MLEKISHPSPTPPAWPPAFCLRDESDPPRLSHPEGFCLGQDQEWRMGYSRAPLRTRFFGALTPEPLYSPFLCLSHPSAPAIGWGWSELEDRPSGAEPPVRAAAPPETGGLGHYAPARILETPGRGAAPLSSMAGLFFVCLFRFHGLRCFPFSWEAVGRRV